MTEPRRRAVSAPTAPTATGPAGEGARQNQSMARVAFASFAGNAIEFYDFFIYGTAAALVFGKTFFPALGPAAATVASFATLGVAFVARPLGAILFGHLGDRVGRKTTLLATLLLMGTATVLVGLMPTADQIGVAAPILLVILRLMQGLAAGGEWAGAVLFATESAPTGKRGFYGMFAPVGGGAALVLGGSAFLLVNTLMSEEAFMSYGWRIPFLASAVLVVLGLYIRLRTEEPQVFTNEVRRSGRSAVPFAEAFRRQPREILLAGGMVVMVPTFTYIGSSYLTNYGASVLGLSFNAVLVVGIVGGAAISAGIILGGIWSDRVGRRRVILTAAVAAVVWAFLLFPVLNIGTPLTFGIGAAVTMFISGLANGPQGAYLPELFHTRYRYTAAGFSYNLAQIIGGAIPPLIAAAVIAAYGSFAFSLILVAFCLLSLGCVIALRETKGSNLSETAT